jgi:hypothetical protein
MTTTTTQPDTPTVAPTVATLVHGTANASPRDFADGIRAVIVAASTDQARPVLTGVLVQQCPDRHIQPVADDPDGKGEYVPSPPDVLTFVATDSYRLHRVDVTVGEELAGLFAVPVLLPAKELANVAKLIGARNVGPVTVTVTDPTVAERSADALADLDSATTTSRVADVTRRYMAGDRRRRVTFATPYTGASLTVGELEGDYPKWENLVPDVDKCQPIASAFIPDFLAVVCKAGSIVAGKGMPVRVRGALEGSPLKPALFTAQRDNLTFTGLLMPVRVP